MVWVLGYKSKSSKKNDLKILGKIYSLDIMKMTF